MTDFCRMNCEEVAARLRETIDTLIIFHRHPDGDAIGSGFALRLLLEAMGCRAFCICEDEIPTRLRFLIGETQTSILPESLPADFAPGQIIAVDTASPAQMGTLYDTFAGRVHLMIDHHGKGEIYADGWVDGTFAAAGQMIYALARELIRTGRLVSIPTNAARLMYAAISADTGCFRYANATPAVHRTAADLLEFQFDAADMNHRLFGIKSEKLMLAEKLAFDRLRLFAEGRIGVVDFPAALKRAHNLSDEDLGTLVDIPRSLAGVEVAVAIRQSDDGASYRVSMRALGEADVSAVCAAFGGGGHKKAAGCTVAGDSDPTEVIHQLLPLILAQLT